SIDRYNVELAGGYLTRLIESAIYLGDIHFLDGTIDWLDGLLSSRGISGSQVKQFYRSYRQAVARELGVQGKLIVEWLEIVESRIS
ncbi:MAG TPA: hypothetical protein VLD65_04500, partial [Anaerolineales bacterium]|nr:hypothetical protein [Anaerolineales bacterium]